MSEQLHYFRCETGRCAVALPFALDAVVDDWDRLRRAMIRELPAPFSRDEWAYLLTFLAADQLRLPYRQTFGEPEATAGGPVRLLARPRGLVSVWLPGNVNLLGPLTLVLVSLTGNPVRMKVGSQGQDLVRPFLEFARARLGDGPLSHYLANRFHVEQFGRDDPGNREMSEQAAVRVVFGTDEAVAAVDALPHRPGAGLVGFGNHQSQAWVEPACVTDDLASILARVFAIYGPAGCTSPRSVVLIGGRAGDVRQFRDRLAALWPKVLPRDVPAHVASQNVMARQWAAALGWDAVLTHRNAAVLAMGSPGRELVGGPMTLHLLAASVEEAIQHLPANIQTIGHALVNAGDPSWLEALARTAVKRFVPLAQMHYFGPVWDGIGFWRQLFEEVEVRP
jgi:Acyl-CoA reductase (LuxC)